MIITPPYPIEPRPSRRSACGAGEHMTVGDLLTAALLPSANDAANALAVRIGGTPRALRGADEPPRAHPRPEAHALRHPGRPRHAGQLLDGPRARQTRHRAARASRSPGARWTSRAPCCARARTGRVVINRNDLVARYRLDQRRQDRAHAQAGLRARRLGDPARHDARSSRSCSAPARGRCATPTRSRCSSYGFADVPRRAARAARRARRAAPLVKGRGGTARPHRRRARTIRRLITARAAGHACAATSPHELTGPAAAPPIVGHVIVRAGGTVIGRVPVR